MAAGTRVLIIPHQPHRNVKVRAVEMAKYLATRDDFEVFMLTWAFYAQPSRSLPGKLFQKTLEFLKTAGTRDAITLEDGIQWVQLPYLLAPYPWCQTFNQRQVESFAREHGIDVVLSANAYHFPMPEDRGIRRVYDVVDDHVSPGSGPVWPRTRAFTLKELRKTDCVLTISHALQDALAAEGVAETTRMPNGVDLASFRNAPPAATEAVRRQYGLNDHFTIGYIGNHGWWAGMDLLLEAFERLQEAIPQSRLLVVGPGEDLERYRAKTAGNASVIYTGPVPPAEIAAYFHAADIGVLPFQICPFTDNALPLKILEYGAARKRVLATPLKELVTLGFPHVELLEPDADTWGEALIREARALTPWQPAWDGTVAAYDWQVVLKDLPALLEGRHAAAV